MRNRWRVVAAVIALTLGATACGSSYSNKGNTPTPTAGAGATKKVGGY